MSNGFVSEEEAKGSPDNTPSWFGEQQSHKNQGDANRNTNPQQHTSWFGQLWFELGRLHLS